MTMRERIARAICEAEGYGSDPEPETARDWEHYKAIGWPYPCKAGWLRYQDHADAVLSELEKPTEGMVLAALRATYPTVIDGGMREIIISAIRAAKESE